MKIGYARVSTKEQSFDLQLDALRKAARTKDQLYDALSEALNIITPQESQAYFKHYRRSQWDDHAAVKNCEYFTRVM